MSKQPPRQYVIDKQEDDTRLGLAVLAIALPYGTTHLVDYAAFAEQAAELQALKDLIVKLGATAMLPDYLRNTSVLTSNPPKNAGVWDLRNALMDLIKTGGLL